MKKIVNMRDLKPPIFFSYNIYMAIYTKGRAFNVPGRNPRRRKIAPKKVVKQAVVRANKRVFEKKVLNVMDKQMEVKQLNVILTENPAGVYNQSIKGGGLADTGAGFNISNLLQKIPIDRGTSSTERIGLSISPKELRLKGYIFASAYNAETNNNPNPFEVVMVAYKRKISATPNPSNLKLNVGDNAPTSITSTIWNDMFDWNRGEFVIKKVRRFKFKAATEIQNLTKPQTETAITNSIVINPQTGDSRLPMVQRFSFAIPIKKELSYDSNSTIPQNDWCAIGFYIINSDGTTCPASHTRAQIYMTGSLKYTDI